MAELSSCDIVRGPQSWKHLLSGPLQKKFPELYSVGKVKIHGEKPRWPPSIPGTKKNVGEKRKYAIL